MSLNRLLACASLTLVLGYFNVVAAQNIPARYSSDPMTMNDFPSELARSLSTTNLGSRAGRAELDALKMFYESRRHEPLWVTSTGYTAAAHLVRAEIERADEWGLEASALRVPPLPEGQTLGLPEQASAEIALSQSILKYAQFARGGRIEPLTVSRNLDRKPQLLDPGKVLAGIVGSDAPDAYLRSLHPQHPQFERLRRLYAGASAELDTGVNLRLIHSERVIVGATTTPTPILSDEMEHLIFHPRWNVPDSIKVNELLPSLEVGDYRVLSRQNLRVALGGRDIDAKSVDWSQRTLGNITSISRPERIMPWGS